MPQTTRKYGVFIQGTEGREQHKRTMFEHPSELFYITDQLSTADVVIFTGGPDIDPAIYGEKNVACEYIDHAMDMADLAAIKASDKKFKIGICRGGQLLNCAVGGGKMWQDVDNHNREHLTKDMVTGEEVRLNSVHHQMMRPGPDGKVIAAAMAASYKDGYDGIWHRDVVDQDISEAMDPEVILYAKEEALCFQPHPEYNHPSTRGYFYTLIDKYVIPALPPF